MTQTGFAPRTNLNDKPPGLDVRHSDRYVSPQMAADLLGCIDFVIITLAAMAARQLYISAGWSIALPLEPSLFAGLSGGALSVLLFRQRRLSGPTALFEGVRHASGLLRCMAWAFLLLIAVAFAFKIADDYARGWLIAWFAMAYGALIAWRAVARSIMRRLTLAGYIQRRLVIVSAGNPDNQLVAAVLSMPQLSLAGVQDIASAVDERGALDPDRLHAVLADVIDAGHANRFDEIIINSAKLSQDGMKAVAKHLGVLPIDIGICTTAIAGDLPIYRFDKLGRSVGVLRIRTNPIFGWGYVLKRVLDYVISAIAVVVFAPLLVAIAVAIKLDSPGPVLFRQRRNGYNQREITVLKFRSMSVAEDGDHVKQAMRNDPRVTRVGRFLRRSSLDELPQLFNVLKGDMSLVGPRPHAIAHNVYYHQRMEGYSHRHRVRPGITGLAQISGLRGETQDPELMRQRVEMDLKYIDSWSIGLDLRIMLLTPVFGLFTSKAH